MTRRAEPSGYPDDFDPDAIAARIMRRHPRMSRSSALFRAFRDGPEPWTGPRKRKQQPKKDAPCTTSS